MEQTPQPRLRPMALADMLDTAFRLYRRHFLTFVGIVALLQVPMAIVQFLAQMPYAQALQRMASHGAEIVTTEMVLFEWLRSAEHPQFRTVSKLIR